MAHPVLVWFRQDMRLSDNPALSAAVEFGAPIIPVFILDDAAAQDWALGGAQRWWMHFALQSLDNSLHEKGSALVLRQGDSATELNALIKDTDAQAVYWNRRYEPWAIAQDKAIKENLKENGIDVHSFNARLLSEPWEVKNGSGQPYKVFTPYWKACLAHFGVHKLGRPLRAPTEILSPKKRPSSLTLKDYDFLPSKPDWAGGMRDAWDIGEIQAQEAVATFIEEGLPNYSEGRDIPGKAYVSRLSPYLATGCISPRQIWTMMTHAIEAEVIDPRDHAQAEHFLREIGWREFSYHLLFAFPELPSKPLNQKFAEFPWRNDTDAMTAWQKGQTGYPIIDAGMRELWQTGWMHNRVRMIVASFLVKNLLQPWQAGEKWFWDTLVDADLASNSASWQWVAGCGADAAPYFRIFNPILQSNKFDADGAYIRRFVPELAKLPDKYLHEPYKAPPEILKAAGIILSKHYPMPIVDLGSSRLRALAALKESQGIQAE